MRKLLFLLLLFPFLAFAQGPQTVENFNIPGNGIEQAYLYVPQEYQNTTKNYPIIFFFHGTGTNSNTLSFVLGDGIPNLIANGMRPDNILAGDGNTYSFIVVSPVSLNPGLIPQYLAQLKQEGYRIDSTRVYLTGLSAGAYDILLTVLDVNSAALASVTAGFVSMSPPNIANQLDYTKLATYHIHSWFFGGNADPYTNPGAVVYNQTANAAYPGSSYLTIFNGGHSGWTTYFNVNYSDPALHMNVYQWLLQWSTGTNGSSPPPDVTPPPPPVVTPPVVRRPLVVHVRKRPLIVHIKKPR